MMLVDCTTCPVRHVRCADCMVTALTAVPLAPPEVPRPVLAEAGTGSAAGAGRPPEVGAPPLLALDRAERHAVSVLLGAGLVTVQEANAARAVPTDAPVPAGASHRRAGSQPGSSTGSRAASRSVRDTRAAG